jgi:hypothetical protein
MTLDEAQKKIDLHADNRNTTDSDDVLIHAICTLLATPAEKQAPPWADIIEAAKAPDVDLRARQRQGCLPRRRNIGCRGDGPAAGRIPKAMAGVESSVCADRSSVQPRGRRQVSGRCIEAREVIG